MVSLTSSAPTVSSSSVPSVLYLPPRLSFKALSFTELASTGLI